MIDFDLPARLWRLLAKGSLDGRKTEGAYEAETPDGRAFDESGFATLTEAAAAFVARCERDGGVRS